MSKIKIGSSIYFVNHSYWNMGDPKVFKLTVTDMWVDDNFMLKISAETNTVNGIKGIFDALDFEACTGKYSCIFLNLNDAHAEIERIKKSNCAFGFAFGGSRDATEKMYKDEGRPKWLYGVNCRIEKECEESDPVSAAFELFKEGLINSHSISVNLYDTKAAIALKELLYEIRTNMTPITRYIRNSKEKHPSITLGQYIDRQAEYHKDALIAVDKILDAINSTESVDKFNKIFRGN